MNAKTKTLKRPLTAFVFDTSVLIHDSDAYKSMDEHYVVIPMAVFEELDDLKNKHGVASVARKVSVDLEQFVQQKGAFTFPGVSLGKGKGKLSFFIARDLHPEVKKLYSQDCADNRIISTALFLKEELCHEKKRKQKNVVQVVLVSNDVILRAKAVALGLAAESYLHDAVDVNSMYTGIEDLSARWVEL